MKRDEAKAYIRHHAKDYLKPDKSNKGFICPICGSGSGKNGTGITTPDGIHFKCWRGCFSSSDIIDIIGQEYGITDYNGKLNKAAEIFNISIDSGNTAEKYEIIIDSNINQHTIAEPQPDYTEFFIKANKNIEKTTYHRGISLETLNRFKVGYIAEWKHPKAPNAPLSPRLIIPTSKESYLARDTRANLTDEQKKYSKSKVGSTHFFNKKALKTAVKPVFIVEGELDALSIIDVGGEAMALGSTSNVKNFIALLKASKPTQPLVIALDADNPGKKAAENLAKGLKELGIPFYTAQWEPYNDANDALMHGREALGQKVTEFGSIEDEANRAKREEYFKNSVSNHLQDFINGITANANTPYIATGFKGLDNAFDGGLYEGLYIVGAISSLGKTTLIIQIADQIAQSGQDVLIFSLEMARTEIMAKSISRHTLQESIDSGGDVRNAKTTRGITTGKRYEKYSKAELDLIKKSINAYSQYSDHLYITEGVGNIGAEQIKQTVEDHINFTGNKPVVIIDYLQILAPYSERATDKQNTDKAVIELKRLSRKYKIPVIAISSFNRTNYTTSVSMEAFKESGAIEYSSDVLIGLQLKGIGEGNFNVNEAKAANPRQVEVVILKNRNGATGVKIDFEYYPLFNYYQEKSNLQRD